MLFEKLVEKIGFAPAVVLCENELSNNFWKKLNFEQWKKIEDAAKHKESLRSRAIFGMLETATSCQKLYDLAEITQCDYPFQKIVQKMFKLAQTQKDRLITIEHLMNLLYYDHTRTIKKAEQQKLLASCNFDELCEILNSVILYIGDEDRGNKKEEEKFMPFLNIIKHAIVSIATDFSHFYQLGKQNTRFGEDFVYNLLQPSILNEFARKKIGGFKDWLKIYDKNAGALTFDCLLGEKIAAIALEQTCKLAKTLKDWWQIYYATCIGNDETAEYVMEKMQSLLNSK